MEPGVEEKKGWDEEILELMWKGKKIPAVPLELLHSVEVEIGLADILSIAKLTKN